MSESLRKAWYRLDLAALPRGVVAVEATANSAGLWFGPVASILEELAEKLPPESHPEIAFLGDRRTYPLLAVLKALTNASNSPINITAQLGRYPVIGPLLWELSRGPTRPLLILANSLLLDAEDWATPEFTGRTLIYRLTGSSTLTTPAFREVGPETELGVLVEHLRDPVQGVRIGHPAAMAVDWDSEAYCWDDGSLQWEASGSLELRAAFVHPGSQPPEAVVARSGGAEHRLALVPIPAPSPPPVLQFTPAEGNVLNLWQRGTPFWCAACSRSHSPGQFLCALPTTGGCLFPTLQGHAPALVYRAESRASEWQLTPLPRGVMEGSDGRIYVNREGAAPIYQFDNGRWEAYAEEFLSFVSLDSNTFLIRPRSHTAN